MRIVLAITVIALALAPAADAWRLEPAPASPFLGPFDDPLATTQGALACALGDANVDGYADLLVRAVDDAGQARLVALAGPGFQSEIWQRAVSATTVLECAPDVGLDGVADLVLRIEGEARAQVEGGPATVQVVLQTVSGATGAITVTRSVAQSAASLGATGAATVEQTVVGTLKPAAAGALAQVTKKVNGVQGALPPGLPLAGLAAQATSSASLTLIDAAGQVAGTVQIDTPGVNPLDLAPIPTGGLPHVAALTSKALNQVEGVAMQVPKLSLHNPDGTLAWATELAATTGVPSLVPLPGDLNLDGVPDLVVQTVTGTISGVPASTFTILSGLDGQVMFVTEAAMGAAAVLPLGHVQGAATLLQAVQAQASGAIQLSAFTGQGQVLWAIEAPAGAVAGNLALDAYTGAVTGFTDLTGDGVADVAYSVAGAGTLALAAIDGATGKLAWEIELPGMQDVQALAFQAQEAVAGVAAQAGQATDLVAFGANGSLDLAVVAGGDGQVRWSVKGAVAGDADVAVAFGGDLDADGVADLLVTVAKEGIGQVLAISTQSGEVLATHGASVVSATSLTLEPGPAYPRSLGETGTELAQETPAAGFVFLVVAVAGVAWLRRR